METRRNGEYTSFHLNLFIFVLKLIATKFDLNDIFGGVCFHIKILNRIHTYAHRAHTHDVHALAVCGDVLLSGGVDSKLCAYSVQNFARVRPRWIPSLPANRSALCLISYSDVVSEFD